jgi:hypothetical protein
MSKVEVMALVKALALLAAAVLLTMILGVT